MKKILIVVDMQNDFITGTLGTQEAQKIVSRVTQKIQRYQKNHDKVYFTKDTHTPDYLNTQEGKNLPVEHCIKNTYGWELHDEIRDLAEGTLALQDHSTIFEKDTFGSKALAETLSQSLEGDTSTEIELVGLCTDICVLSNALLLKAYMPEVTISVDATCCAGVTPESHLNALNAMTLCQIQVDNTLE